jgi:hypothetical protein
MCADNGAVDEDILKVRFIGKLLEKTFPYAISAPAVEPLIDAVPLAKLWRQNTPVRA